jgi:hypothetical protein
MLVEQKNHEALSSTTVNNLFKTDPFDIDPRELKKENNPAFIDKLPTPISTPLTPTPFTPLFIPEKH